MRKTVLGAMLLLFPWFALAANSSFTFTPPATDLSVVLLGNLFGAVDGVLHGSGSQIMGAIFAVFNSAVLALGGMLITYTLIVSTMNTAHEGQMLGQKWSSIWIPVRSTLGLALMIPKASGYCMMQVFVMWIVIQGVGAADKLWGAALGYLNRGGVIVKSHSNPTQGVEDLTKAGIPGAAQEILIGQVCMFGLQKQLETQRQAYLNLKQNNQGPCANSYSAMKAFCDTSVPNFIDSVNMVQVQNNSKGQFSFTAPMPNFSSGPYKDLNGICGAIKWDAVFFPAPLMKDLGKNSTQSTQTNIEDVVGTEGMETAKMSRAIAIQQMYLNLSSVAQIMVNNAPEIRGITRPDAFSSVAQEQFGVPYDKQGNVCTQYNQTCIVWKNLPNANQNAVLFNGTEFQGAVSAYNGVMLPTLSLMKQAFDTQSASAARKFINDAKNKGWILSGAYFFDLLRLQGSATEGSHLKDGNSGLEKSLATPSNLTDAFPRPGKCATQYAVLCEWFQANNSQVKAVINLINGASLVSPPILKPDMKPTTLRVIISDKASSTVYGFVNNSMMVQLPNQPGIATMQFANLINISVDPTMYYAQEQSFPCGQVKIVFFSFCLGQLLGNIFYNLIFRYVFNAFLTIAQQFVNQLVMAFIMIPLTGLAQIFKDGVTTISAPGVNPVIALAKMGVHYINFSANMWLLLFNTTMIAGIALLFTPIIIALIMIQMPIFLSWLGIMVGIGFATAFYIPMLPYIIFTMGAMAWFITVIEAMVAAPIIALGIAHPEGHDAFGRSESSVLMLMSVFLRPSMMIIGYITGIVLCYVGIWVLNAGFEQAVGFIQTGGAVKGTNSAWGWGGHPDNPGTESVWTPQSGAAANLKEYDVANTLKDTKGSGTGGYKEWAGLFAFFFSLLSYTTLYMIIAQKSFTLINYLPDQILRWIGGQPESIGQQATAWGDEAKKQIDEAVKAPQDSGRTGIQDAQGQVDKALGSAAANLQAHVGDLAGKIKKIEGTGKKLKKLADKALEKSDDVDLDNVDTGDLGDALETEGGELGDTVGDVAVEGTGDVAVEGAGDVALGGVGDVAVGGGATVAEGAIGGTAAVAETGAVVGGTAVVGTGAAAVGTGAAVVGTGAAVAGTGAAVVATGAVVLAPIGL